MRVYRFTTAVVEPKGIKFNKKKPDFRPVLLFLSMIVVRVWLLAAQFFENFISFLVVVVFLVVRDFTELFNGKINLLVF